MLYAVLIGANIGGRIWAWAAFAERPALLGLALLVWVFGLRHAVDADHIAAIDNAVRKLLQDGQRPISVGFFFSLGHSTVVVLVSAVVAMAAGGLKGRLDALQSVGSVVGTTVSAVFLLLIALANLAVLPGIWRSFRAVARGASLDRQALDTLLNGRGCLLAFCGRCFAPSAEAGTCIRSDFCSVLDSTRPPRSACWASRPPRRRKVSPRGTTWFFRRCSRPA